MSFEHPPRGDTVVLHVSARDNPQLVRARKLAADAALARREGLVWVEGEHLVRAACARGWRVAQGFVSDEAWATGRFADVLAQVPKVIVTTPRLMASLASLESPPPLAMLLHRPGALPVDPEAASVVLDRVQDPGNVGSILRSASAFGFHQVLALPGTAALWSAKVLRAGMGAHFALRLFEQASATELDALRSPWLGTSSHAVECLGEAALPKPCTWLIGHEGQGIAAPLLARCEHVLRIDQPGGEESLNAAVAAAICMHESVRGRTPSTPRRSVKPAAAKPSAGRR